MPERDVVADLAPPHTCRAASPASTSSGPLRAGAFVTSRKRSWPCRNCASPETTSRRPRCSSGPRVLSAVNDPNDYQGPGTGYRLDSPGPPRYTISPKRSTPGSLAGWMKARIGWSWRTRVQPAPATMLARL